MAIAHIGFDLDFIKDGVNAVAGAVSDVASAGWDLVDDIPGFDILGEGVKDLVNGPLRDFANTAVGKTVLRALAGSMYAVGVGVMGPFLGAQLASAAFALPELARGEDFWDAWFQESLYRATETAKILGTDAALEKIGPQLQEGFDRIKEFAPEYSSLSVSELSGKLGLPDLSDVSAIAKRLGIDNEWVAAMIRARLFPDQYPIPSRTAYDVATGKSNAVRSLGRVKPKAPIKVTSGVSTKTVSAALSRFVPTVLSAPPAVEEVETASVVMATAPSSSALDKTGNVALVAVGTAGAMAFAWWYLRRGARR